MPRIKAAVERYHQWIDEMRRLQTHGDDKVRDLVSALNKYKRYIELDVIWDSPNEFLYRQRGQLKLDNSILEEFLPWLIDPDIVPGLAGKSFVVGPKQSFAAIYFQTDVSSARVSSALRTKDQDFTISRTAYLKASYDPNFANHATDTHEINLAIVAAECKTNLDKTMFQEAVATAHDLRTAVPGANYFLICEWLDMKPISTTGTDITEVLFLRGRRMNSDQRKNLSTPAVRQQRRDWYIDFLNQNPIREERVLRFVNHLRAIFGETEVPEDDILERGYF